MHRLAIWYELIETKPAMTNVRFQDGHAALFGRLRGTLTTSWRGSSETSRLKLARLNVKISASVRAGGVPEEFSLSYFLDIDFNLFKVFLSIRHLWSPDKGVSTKWGGQVRAGGVNAIEKKHQRSTRRQMILFKLSLCVQIQSTGSIQGETGLWLPGKPVWIT